MIRLRQSASGNAFFTGESAKDRGTLSPWIGGQDQGGGENGKGASWWATPLTGFLAIFLIGLVSQYTDQRMSTSLLYLVPILLVTRASGFGMGLCAALLAGGLWFATDLREVQGLGGMAIPAWNAFMRLGTFFVAVCLVSAMKSMNRTLEERVSARTAELKAKLVENSQLERRILEVSDLEQSRIGQDLHDGLCQELVSLAFSLNLLQEKVAAGDPLSEREVTRLQGIADDAISQARDLARGLFPASLETGGLEIALRELAARVSDRSGQSCFVECERSLPEIRLEISSQLYRIAQEAVTNAVKHAGGGAIRIELSATSAALSLRVVDGGKGMALFPNNQEGMGVRIMAYRARMIGARIRFQTGYGGRGLAVTCEWPLENR